MNLPASRLVFVADLPYEVGFQLRSTFRNDQPDLAGEPCPALYLSGLDREEPPLQLLGAGEIDAVGDLDDLRELVRSAVDGVSP